MNKQVPGSRVLCNEVKCCPHGGKARLHKKKGYRPYNLLAGKESKLYVYAFRLLGYGGKL